MASEIHLLQGDCLQVLPTLPDKSVDAIITDLPYGTTACKWDVIIPLDEMWKQVKRICKGAFVTTASQPFTSVLITSNLPWFKYDWVWNKNAHGNFASLKYQPAKTHESVLIFGNGSMVYNPQMEQTESEEALRRARAAGKSSMVRRSAGSSEHAPSLVRKPGHFQEFVNPKSILKIKCVPRQHIEHPTQKPVALYEYLIRTYTNEGDTVLDFCMGSGTTGVACVKTNRNFIGIEKEHEYFAIAERRITDAQLQLSMSFTNA